jgi:hypothetical protein
MFEQFSSGYYLGRLYVEPGEGETAKMCQAQHEQVNEQLYADCAITPLDRPLVMKLGTTHIAVEGNAATPADTLTVPESVLDAAGVDNPPELSEVLLAKEEQARQLLSLGRST